MQEWLARPNVFVPEPTARHAAILATLVPVVDRAGLVPHAHLARLPGLRWMDPLAG